MEINADVIKLLITSKKLKQISIARQIGINPKSLSLILRTGKASMETITKLARVLQVQPEEIMLPPTEYSEAVKQAVQLVAENPPAYFTKEFMEALEKMLETKITPLVKALEQNEGLMEIARTLAKKVGTPAEEKRGEEPQKERREGSG